MACGRGRGQCLWGGCIRRPPTGPLRDYSRMHSLNDSLSQKKKKRLAILQHGPTVIIILQEGVLLSLARPSVQDGEVH